MAKGSGSPTGPPAGSPSPAPDSFQETQELLAILSEENARYSETLDRVGIGIGRLQTAMQAVQTVLQGVSTVSHVAHLALNGFQTAVQGVANQIGGLVRLVNPGVLDRFTRAFATFQAQLGQVFLPVLIGLTGLVQTVANALAGLTPPGRMFIVFLSGAAAGLAAAVTVGGIFLGVFGSVVGGLIAGAVAAEAFDLALTGATAGFSKIGAIIGAVAGTLVTIGAAGTGASAGGLAALSLASGGLEKFTKALEPFLKVMVGTLDTAGAAILPQAAAALESIVPSLTQLLTEMVQYLPLFGELLVSFASGILPPLITAMAEILRVSLPVVAALTKFASVQIQIAGATMTAVVALGKLISFISVLGAVADSGAFRTGQAGSTGTALAPVASASYGGVEDMFRRANEQSVLGLSGQQDDPFKKVMNDTSTINLWTQGMVNAFSNLLSGQSFTQALTRGMLAAIRGG